MLVGSGGPGGLRGVAPGATVLPIRVAGWQPNVSGTDAVYARTDQLLAGLDRAVDPNNDGDAHDAVRIALVGVDEPYAAFADGPEARAVQGALELNTLVVAPAGNDGAAGPAYGSVGGPAGAPDALAVGATDGRAETSDAFASCCGAASTCSSTRRCRCRLRRSAALAEARRRRRRARSSGPTVRLVEFFDANGREPRRGPRRARAGRRHPAGGGARGGARRRRGRAALRHSRCRPARFARPRPWACPSSSCRPPLPSRCSPPQRAGVDVGIVIGAVKLQRERGQRRGRRASRRRASPSTAA